jgi:hypothetical protein
MLPCGMQELPPMRNLGKQPNQPRKRVPKKTAPEQLPEHREFLPMRFGGALQVASE